MWKERKNGKHAVLSKDKILVNGIPFDLGFYEKTHHLGPENAGQKEKEKTENSRIDWGKIKEELNKLKDNIYSLRPDNTKENEAKTVGNQTIRNEDHPQPKNQKKNQKEL